MVVSLGVPNFRVFMVHDAGWGRGVEGGNIKKRK